MNPKYLGVLGAVLIVVITLLYLAFRKCPSPPVVDVEIKEDVIHMSTTERSVFDYLQNESKEHAKDVVDKVKDLFDVNELSFQEKDVLMFVHAVREWDDSVRKLSQADIEHMYNTLNTLDVQSEMLVHVLQEHVTTTPPPELFKKIVKQLAYEAVKGELYNVLFK
jgi:hypothetical protein